MKTLCIILTGLPLIAGSLVTAAQSDAKAAPRAEVVFDHPEKFSDVKDDSFGTEKGREAILEQLRDYIQNQAQYYVAPGQTLTITFSDIDLAGDYEPRGGRSDDIRIVREVYPPRMDLSFRLTDASGAVIKEGTRRLRDLNFMMALNVNREDPLRYDKNLLDDWLRKEFPRKK